MLIVCCKDWHATRGVRVTVGGGERRENIHRTIAIQNIGMEDVKCYIYLLMFQTLCNTARHRATDWTYKT